MKVIELPKNRYAILCNVEDEKVFKTLERIPGLYLNRDESRFEGRLDAVCAGCLRLEIPGPTGTSTQQTSRVVIPVQFDLKQYQIEGVHRTRFIASNYGGALLADDMGLGKTRQAIAFAKTFGKHRKFVIGPAMQRETWRDELKKLGENSVAILTPGKTKKILKEWETAETKEWVVSSYEFADRAFESAFPDAAPGVLLIDELHNLRGRKAQRYESIRNIAQQINYKLGLTGTPQWSRLRDWWAISTILWGSIFGSKYDFDREYCGGKLNEHGGWNNHGATNTDEFKKRLSFYMVRRTKAEVAHELPKIQRQVLWIDPSKEAEVAFHSAIATKNHGARMAAFQATLAGKIEAALDLAVQAKRFLLFTYLKSHAHQMAKKLAEELDTPCVCITGDLDPARRQALVRAAVAQRIGVVATIDSAGTGIDGLQNSISVGIMHSLDYVPIKMAQAEGRIDRIGQKEPVMWYYLAMKDSMDSLTVRTIVSKMDQTRAVMGQRENVELRNALSDSASLENQEQALKELYESL
jgi:SWI/SNF-related matrix-associated actin-dependent regulator 1 of chromatin subfamily A